MNDQVNTATAEQVNTAQGEGQNPLVREQTFTFRKIPLADFVSLAGSVLDKEFEDVTQVPSDFKSNFEFSEDGKTAKRKPVKGTIVLPEFIQHLPKEDGTQDIIAGIVEKELAQFVKYQYIDNFQPIGDHDLETYQKVLASSGRRIKWDYTAEQLAAAVKSINEYISQAVGNRQVGERFAAAAKQKFSRTAIQRYLGSFDESLLNKVKVRLADWMQHVCANEPEGEEEYGTIYMMLDTALEKHLNAEHVDVSELL